MNKTDIPTNNKTNTSNGTIATEDYGANSSSWYFATVHKGKRTHQKLTNSQVDNTDN